MSGTTGAPSSFTTNRGVYGTYDPTAGLQRQQGAIGAVRYDPTTNQTTYANPNTNADGSFAGTYGTPNVVAGTPSAMMNMDPRMALKMLQKPQAAGATFYGANGQPMDMSGGIPQDWLTALQAMQRMPRPGNVGPASGGLLGRQGR